MWTGTMSKGASWVVGAGVAVLAWGAVACGGDVIWDFENGNDHGFELTCVSPATAAPDAPTVAGDEAITGVGGPKGLPGAGIAWSIGRPDQFDGTKPAVQEGDKARADGTMEYNQAGKNHPFEFPTNGRGQESYLNTFNLTEWGDNVHTAANDQIAKSPLVVLGQGAVLTVWAQGGGSGTHAPALDSSPLAGYTNGSSGIAVISVADGSLLASVLTNGQGTLRQDTLNLSAFAGQKVRIEVVDAFAGSWGWLAVDEIRITNAVAIQASRAQATVPNPPDEAADVPVDVVLSWMPGEHAPASDGHQVYFSTSFDDVNEGLVEASRAITSDPVFDTADLPFALGLGTTYYWRIDEANAVSGWDRGQVWSFTTEPVSYPITNLTATASSAAADMGPEKTVNGAGLTDGQHSIVDTDMWLSGQGTMLPAWIRFEFDGVYQLDGMTVWNSNQRIESFIGFGARNVTIEYSLDGAEWSTLGDVEIARATGIDTYAGMAVDLAGVLAKFVRLTINSNWSGFVPQTGLSEVWFSYIPVRARAPQPATGAADVAVDSVLSWRAGRQAATHEVYLSTDEQAVVDGTAPLEVVTTSRFTPDTLDYGQAYYWKVNEVNEAATPDRWEGDVWSFATKTYGVVDDFESYNDQEDQGTRIYETWIDGFGTTTNGSQVGNLQAPFAERTIIHGGAQSMPLTFDNTGGKTSEAIRTFETAQDWTVSGIKSLSLWFYGDPDNTGQLYLKINNTKVPYDSDSADITKKQWQPWNIDLSAVGGSLENVIKLTIGIEGASAAGVIYVDDIRLYPKTPEVIVPVDPGKIGLLAEYLFDNGATDSSGKGHNGTLLGNAQTVEGVLVLDGTDDAASIPRLGGPNATFTQCTYSMWMYSIREPATAGIIGGINSNNWTTGGIHCKIVDGHANAGVNSLAGGDMNGKTIVGPDEWVHLALIVSDTEAAIYLNGQPEGSRGFSMPMVLYLGNGCIGAWNNNNDIQRELTGKMDDVRIYDRAVSEAELLWLAGKRTPVQKPF